MNDEEILTLLKYSEDIGKVNGAIYIMSPTIGIEFHKHLVESNKTIYELTNSVRAKKFSRGSILELMYFVNELNIWLTNFKEKYQIKI